MGPPESREPYFADRERVLNMNPLRSLAPVFPSADNFSSFPIPNGAPRNVYAPPAGPFPPGVARMYPVFIAPESERQGERNTPPGLERQTGVSHAVPVNSYGTQQTHFSSMDPPESRELYFSDRERVLNIKPLRSLAPGFLSADNFSSFPMPNGAPPNVYAPPSGLFPPGVAPKYPVFVVPESERHGERNSHHFTPPGSQRQAEVSHADPVNSYRTQQTAGSGQVHFSGTNVTAGSDEDGYNDSFSMQTANAEGRSPKMARTAMSADVDTDRIIDDIRPPKMARTAMSGDVDANRIIDNIRPPKMARTAISGDVDTDRIIDNIRPPKMARTAMSGDVDTDRIIDSIRPPTMARTAMSGDVDTNRIIDNILGKFDLSAFTNAHRLNGNKNIVRFVLAIFDFFRRKVTQNDELMGANPGAARRPDLRAGTLLMIKGVRTNVKKRIGAVPGVKVGDIFYCRMELCMVGLHSPAMGGIDFIGGTTDVTEEPLAVSIVSAGGYEDDVEDGAQVLIYTVQGGKTNGKDKVAKNKKLERGNRALQKSVHRGNEVRVIRRIEDPFSATGKIYVYDGLYKTQESWVDKESQIDRSGATIFKHKLIRLPGQAQVFSLWQSIQMWKDGVAIPAGSILSDISSGAETLPVALTNDVDGEKEPGYFTYLPSLHYPKPINLMEPYVSCSCTGGCLPMNNSCPCVLKNGDHLPYNVNGILVTKKSMIYECGPCHCPPNCKNRVSQNGIKVRLEVFRTKEKGWGLRSWDPIRAGTFICEYAGEVIDKSKMENLRVHDEDDYIFDATRSYQPLEFLPTEYNEDPEIPFPLHISAKDSGNVARFMNHSCSPTVFWQPVMRGNQNVYDIHIVFHAIKHIPPMAELTFDYGIDHSDVANQLKKRCLCRSEKCRGYFY